MDEDRFVTTKDDIISSLSKYPKCLDSTIDGKLIISYEELPNILLNTFNKKAVYNLIINSKIKQGKIGHWTSLIVFNSKILFLLDGLNEIKSQIQVITNIKTFAKNNNLKIYDFNVRYQKPSSKKCGFLACFFVYKSITCSLPKFLKLRKMLLNNSVSTNENYIFNFVKKKFGLSF